LRVPEHLAGRRLTCPGCEGAVSAPPAETPPEEAAAAPEVPDITAGPWPSQLGAVSAGLGLVSVLIHCLPLLRYGALALSGAGLLLGAVAVVGALRGGAPAPGVGRASGAAVARGFGTRAVDLPLAGVVACSLALALAVLPLLTG
jgi:hypothetical protein